MSANKGMANLRQVLYAWRDNEASKRGVDLFRILPNSAIDEIVKVLPRTKEELTSIKGIKDAKYNHFGKTILSLVDEHMPGGRASAQEMTPKINKKPEDGFVRAFPKQEETVFSVSTYLDIVNNALWRLSARVQGEVMSFKVQGSAIYMSIKDAKDESVMNVFMWLTDYEMAGFELSEGLEVIVEGKSEIYKPSGRFSFRAQTIELVGEGALKAQYDALKKKLELEGVFSSLRKRHLPEFPERIGLITSKTGAVIHDFLNNLGKFGYSVRFFNSRVEGASAVKDLLRALKYFKDEQSTRPIEVLVLIRGGGSLESLQAFNNELVVRAIQEFPVPVICAIGHDKDVPLAQFAADFAPSTPTASTALLNASWNSIGSEIKIAERVIVGAMNRRFLELQTKTKEDETFLMNYFSTILAMFQKHAEALRAYVPLLGATLERMKREAEDTLRITSSRYRSMLGRVEDQLKQIAHELESHNPLRQLKLGYSILSHAGKVLRSTVGRKVGEHFEARLSDGTLGAVIERINK